MRARRGKQKKRPAWLDDIDPKFTMPRPRSVDRMLDIENEEVSQRDDAIEAAVAFRKEYEKAPMDQKPRIPYIAGYTDAANASPAMRAAGYEKWAGMTPQERYERSALGQSESFSMEGPSPGRAVLSDMAQGNSYWAGLARNIATGSPLPEARLPDMDAFEGQRWSNPANTSPLGETAEHVGGTHVGPNTPAKPPAATQRPLNWSEMDAGMQEKIQRIAEQNGVSVEEVLRQYYSAGGTGRRGRR